MKLRNIFENDNDIEQQLKKLFTVHGKINIFDDVVNVEGNISIQPTKKIASLPFTLGVIGDLDLLGAGLKTLQGMPTKAEIVDVSENDAVKDLLGCEQLECEEFYAAGLGLRDLKHCPLSPHYDFDGCPLESLQGLRTERLESLTAISKTLVDIKPVLENQHRDVSEASVKLSYNSNMPLVYLTVVAGQDGFFPIEIADLPTEVERILTPYRGKGLGTAIELAIKLRDQGYRNNARLR